MPTKVISPDNMLSNCGSSSNLHPRNAFPTFVILVSPFVVTCVPILSALLTIVRNLKIRKVLPYVVTLTCRKKTGPLESSLMQTASIKSSGDKSTSNTPATIISKRRFRIKLALCRCKIS